MFEVDRIGGIQAYLGNWDGADIDLDRAGGEGDLSQRPQPGALAPP